MTKVGSNLDFNNQVTGINIITPVATGDIVPLGYLNTRRTPTGIDASTNPNYPAALAGETFYFTVAGLIGGGAGSPVEVEDYMVALVDTAGGTEAAAGADFILIQTNLDQADQTTRGYVRFATQGETDTGTSTVLAISPSTLAGYLDNLDFSRTETFTIGDNASTTLTVTHTLTNQYVNVDVYEIATGEKWIVETDITGATTFDLIFAVAPTLNQFEVVVTGVG